MSNKGFIIQRFTFLKPLLETVVVAVVRRKRIKGLQKTCKTPDYPYLIFKDICARFARYLYSTGAVFSLACIRSVHVHQCNLLCESPTEKIDFAISNLSFLVFPIQ